jgi:parvulin-like peptidyl-prolyl isomerase
MTEPAEQTNSRPLEVIATHPPQRPPASARPTARPARPTKLLFSVAPFRKVSEEVPAFSANGLHVDPEHYSHGLARFLAGRQPTIPLVNQYRLLLEEQLLVVACLLQRGADATGMDDLDAHGRMALLEALAAAHLERWPDGRPIAESDVRSLYELRADRYVRPERVQIRLILVPTEEEADEVFARLAHGEPFGEIAASESRHDSRSRSGEIDSFARGTYDAEFERVAFSLEPGAIGRVETVGGIYLLQKLASIPPVQVPYEQVREELYRELARQLRDAQVSQLRAELDGGG